MSHKTTRRSSEIKSRHARASSASVWNVGAELRPWAREESDWCQGFVAVSAGVSNAEFTETLALAGEAGTNFSGVLCGRATWKDGIPVYGKQGGAAFRAWLEDQGVKNIQNVNKALAAARPWTAFYE